MPVAPEILQGVPIITRGEDMKLRGVRTNRFRVFDRERECYLDPSNDLFQAIVWYYERDQRGANLKMREGGTIPCPRCNGTMAARQTGNGTAFICGECREEIPISREIPGETEE